MNELDDFRVKSENLLKLCCKHHTFLGKISPKLDYVFLVTPILDLYLENFGKNTLRTCHNLVQHSQHIERQHQLKTQ